jgi:hypothetical protein
MTGCIHDTYTIYTECPFYCWESFLDAADIPSDEADPPYYTQLCTQEGGGSSALLVPLPEKGYGARTCYSGGSPANAAGNSEHYFLVAMAIVNLLGSNSLNQSQEDAYDLAVLLLDQSAVESCVAHLTCNGSPGAGCDIDETVSGEQSCTVGSANALCTAQIEGVLEGQLALPSPEKYPECSGIQYYETSVALCQGHVPDMNGTGGYCADDGFIPGTGSTSMGSADTTGANLEPFGDLGALIRCDGTACDLDPELIINVMEHFGEFYDDEVTLLYVDDAACDEGVQVDGLSSGTAPTELAGEFNIENGDIITQVNGIYLDRAASFATALQELDSETEFTVVVKRPDGMACTKTTWTLEIIP